MGDSASNKLNTSLTLTENLPSIFSNTLNQANTNSTEIAQQDFDNYWQLFASLPTQFIFEDTTGLYDLSPTGEPHTVPLDILQRPDIETNGYANSLVNDVPDEIRVAWNNADPIPNNCTKPHDHNSLKEIANFKQDQFRR